MTENGNSRRSIGLLKYIAGLIRSLLQLLSSSRTVRFSKVIISSREAWDRRYNVEGTAHRQGILLDYVPDTRMEHWHARTRIIKRSSRV